MPPTLTRAAKEIAKRLSNGATIYTAGNGGSAAQAMHLTSEFMGKYGKIRPPIRSMFLGMDPCTMTCIGNDFGYDNVFSRPAEAFVTPKDVVVVYTTSGNSMNIRDLLFRLPKGVFVVAFLGKGGGATLAELSRLRAPFKEVLLSRKRTTRGIQEEHLKWTHDLVEQVESWMG